MCEIPPDLYPEILSRLFAKSLMKFRCVCKAWCRIIDDPAFVKLHLHRQSDSGQLMFYYGAGTKHYTLSLDSLHCYSSKTPTGGIVASTLKKLIRGDVPDIPTLPVPSCNGLILFSSNFGTLSDLCNPFTREVRELPSYTTPQEPYFKRIGLGYDSVTDDYKVVEIVVYNNRGAVDYRGHTLVYSLRSNSWRRVKDCPYDVCRSLIPGVFVNGALHWTSTMRGDDELMIHAFDLATEDYYTLPLPNVLSKPRGRAKIPILDAFGQCLLLTWCDSVYRLDDYGGQNLWTKLFSLSVMGLGNARLMAYLKSKGEFLFRGDNDKYFWVNIEKKSAKKFTIWGAPDHHLSQTFLASLVRLSNSNGFYGSNYAAKVITKRKKKRGNGRKH